LYSFGWPLSSAGLFHFAIILPDRKSLALTYLASRGGRVRYEGSADHLVSEALYLRDPENNGIEIYRDRPSKEWARDSEGHIMMDTFPLNLNSLVSEELNKGERHTQKHFLVGQGSDTFISESQTLKGQSNFTMKN